MGTMSEPRHALEQVTSLITRHFGANLHGLYLFGSLPAGAFRPGKSDLDLVAVLGADVEDGEELDALTELHSVFVTEHPEWSERAPGRLHSHTVLHPVSTGRIAVISQVSHFKAGCWADRILNWRSVSTQGETIVGYLRVR
jgi:predicted nucleotidyltransferase